MKGSCPRPLDDGGEHLSGQRDSNARHQPWQGCTLPLSYARFMLKVEYIITQTIKQKYNKTGAMSRLYLLEIIA